MRRILCMFDLTIIDFECINFVKLILIKSGLHVIYIWIHVKVSWIMNLY